MQTLTVAHVCDNVCVDVCVCHCPHVYFHAQVAECLEAHADIDTAAGGSTGTHAAIRGLLAASCPHKGVGAFVWSVLRHILPPALLGNKHNQRCADLSNMISYHVCITMRSMNAHTCT